MTSASSAPGTTIPDLCADAGPNSPRSHAAAEALRGLTKTQRIYVRAGCFHGDITMNTVRALLRNGLFYIHIDSPNGQCGLGRLTALGEDVRALLAARADGTRVAAQVSPPIREAP